MTAEEELRQAQVVQFEKEELSEFEWEGLPKTVRLEIPLRYMSRMELRELLNTIAGQVQKAIHATHEDKNPATMIHNIAFYLDAAQRANKAFRDKQGERVRKRNEVR